MDILSKLRNGIIFSKHFHQDMLALFIAQTTLIEFKMGVKILYWMEIVLFRLMRNSEFGFKAAKKSVMSHKPSTTIVLFITKWEKISFYNICNKCIIAHKTEKWSNLSIGTKWYGFCLERLWR